MSIKELIDKAARHKGLGWVAVTIAAYFLINPGAGVLGEIPDVIPILGNLDEATAVALFLWGLAVLRGKPISFGEGTRKNEKAAVEVSPPEDVPPSDSESDSDRQG
jgi:hypothetical protein